MLRYSTIVLLCSLFASIPLLTQQDKAGQDKQKKQDKQDKIDVAEGPESIARRDFMRTKLMYSQNIFEGLTTGDFQLVDDAIDEIRGITAAEQWVAVDDDRYRKLTEDFKTTIERLREAAETENIDATAFRYYQMSTSCIDCHKHIRKAGYTL